MIEARQGYHEGAARAMYEAHKGEPEFERKQEPLEAFLQRVSGLGMFFGLFKDDIPVGTFLVDSGLVHVAVLKEARGDEMSEVLNACAEIALRRWPCLIARIRADNPSAIGLAEKYGFKFARKEAKWRVYIRSAL